MRGFITKLAFVALFSTLATLLAACGKVEEIRPAPPSAVPVREAEPEPKQSQGGRCGSQVLSDYRTMRTQCSRILSSGQLERCRGATESFLAAYPKADCTARIQDAESGELSEQRLSAREAEEILERLKAIGAGPAF